MCACGLLALDRKNCSVPGFPKAVVSTVFMWAACCHVA